jgi:haloacid dehalogenase-like hydrolase
VAGVTVGGRRPGDVDREAVTSAAESMSMMPRALTCDYDGTLATEDRLAPATVAALEQARAAGLHLILLTGRTFFELTRVCERLDLFDAVVAENGAVLYFPRPETLRDLAPAPPPRLLAELDRRRIVCRLGRVVVEGDFSRCILGVFSDPSLGQQLRKIETRWRRGEIPDLRNALDRLVAARYGS